MYIFIKGQLQTPQNHKLTELKIQKKKFGLIYDRQAFSMDSTLDTFFGKKLVALIAQKEYNGHWVTQRMKVFLFFPSLFFIF